MQMKVHRHGNNDGVAIHAQDNAAIGALLCCPNLQGLDSNGSSLLHAKSHGRQLGTSRVMKHLVCVIDNGKEHTVMPNTSGSKLLVQIL